MATPGFYKTSNAGSEHETFRGLFFFGQKFFTQVARNGLLNNLCPAERDVLTEI